MIKIRASLRRRQFPAGWLCRPVVGVLHPRSEWPALPALNAIFHYRCCLSGRMDDDSLRLLAVHGDTLNRLWGRGNLQAQIRLDQHDPFFGAESRIAQ